MPTEPTKAAVMSKPVVTPIRTAADDEAAIMQQLEEEAAKKEALDAQQQVAAAQIAATAQAGITAKTKISEVRRIAGDVYVTCLKDETSCTMGGRAYVLKKGSEIQMDPSHAEELSAGPNPWVATIRVVTSSRSRHAE